jgi:hypothetical protein
VENDYFINRMNISHYQALLRTNLDDKKRVTIKRLLTELETHHSAQSYPNSLPALSIIF